MTSTWRSPHFKINIKFSDCPVTSNNDQKISFRYYYKKNRSTLK